ncbi:histidine kinase dimerization/phosphoacceptor domain -containing protein [Blastomonas sp. AAP53]|uniref:sensor histidine kinase n=1 Tax=Blastomonas sp. AAP53 TaxID=1248760 RepID=UPI00031FAA02|nr:histidine kinase dimerization/phosphoacceptor domain -containing protein [Blastomonas sp. AAP53]
MDRIVSAGAIFRKDAWLGYGLAVLSFAVALFIRLELQGTLPPGFPYLTFFPAVILTTFLAGLWPGIACATLCGIASLYFFIPPSDSFAIDGASSIAIGFYIFIVTVDIALIHFMHRAADRLMARKQVMESLYDQQRTMFQELQHRVANNMTFVAALLHLQKRNITADPASAINALDEAQSRIETMSRIHRRLYDPASVDLPVAEYFQEICSDLLQATGARNIVCMVDMPAVRLDIARLTTLSLLVTELVTNSLKHAFTDDGGTISLKLERLSPDRLALTVSDNGRGMQHGVDTVANKGLGTRIIQSLAAQLGGEVKALTGLRNGVAWQLEFSA